MLNRRSFASRIVAFFAGLFAAGRLPASSEQEPMEFKRPKTPREMLREYLGLPEGVHLVSLEVFFRDDEPTHHLLHVRTMRMMVYAPGKTAADLILTVRPPCDPGFSMKRMEITPAPQAPLFNIRTVQIKEPPRVETAIITPEDFRERLKKYQRVNGNV